MFARILYNFKLSGVLIYVFKIQLDFCSHLLHLKRDDLTILVPLFSFEF